ncbi:MAG: TldD/PmbA family protein [Candidatus Goldbacteria bacterium]|nr:TldD/PmbA family protein [Candidatus Goldiibacteriota bacterium]
MMQNKAARLFASKKFDLWDIYREKSIITLITFDNNKIDKISTGIDEGTGLRVIKNNKTLFGFTNSLEKEYELAKSFVEDSTEKEINFSFIKPDIIHSVKIPPENININEKINLLKKINDLARSEDNRIKQVTITYSEKIQDIEIINDMGIIINDKRTYTSLIIFIVGAADGKIETAHSVISGLCGYEIIDDKLIDKKVKDTVRIVVQLLETDKKIVGEMPVIISSEAGGTMIHEAVGHSLEADQVEKGLSIYTRDMVGKKVASDIVTVCDDPTLPNRRGSYSFDDEGVKAVKKVLIENGILRDFIYDRENAFKHKVKSNGGGRRESYRFRPIPRMSNTYIVSGKGNPEDLIKDTQKGLFVKKMGGGQVNTVTGEFIFDVKEGYMIENGKITYPVRDATLLGKGTDVLNSIDAVCSDIGFDVGTCGKDGQGVPVADGLPTIRISKFLIGSK